MNLNNINVAGRLTKDCHIKFTPSGVAVCNFTVAVNEKWKNKDGEPQEKAEFINVAVWDKQAESCNKYLKKGSLVFLTGKLTTRSWNDTTGKKCYFTEVNASNVQFIGGKADDEQEPEPTF